MTEIKVTFNMLVPGAKMLTKEACESSPIDNYDINKLHLAYREKGKKKFDDIIFRTRKSIPAKQVINITKDSYEFMISNEGWGMARVNSKLWKSMNKKQRLEAHLALIAENFKAIKWSYQILND